MTPPNELQTLLSNASERQRKLGEALRKLKFNHHPNLGTKILAVIAGRSGAGKTQLLFKILTTPGFLDYNNLIIFTRTAHQPIYQCLLHGFNNGLTKNTIAAIFKIYDDSDAEENIEELCKEASLRKELLSPKNEQIKVTLTDDPLSVNNPTKLDSKLKHCCVFDDCVNDKDQTVQNTYFTSGRHSNCSVFYLTQNLYALNTTIRRNANIFILFELDNRSFLEILKIFPLSMRTQFKQTAERLWDEPFGYITYNQDLPKNKRIIDDFFEASSS